MLPNANTPFGVRLTIYSYLNNPELLTKVSKLCKYDRENLPNSHIVCTADRVAIIDFDKMKNPSRFMKSRNSYLWNLFPQSMIVVNQIVPKKIKP